jgi:hypothetical protein
VLPGVSAKSPSDLGRLSLPLELVDFPSLANRLTVHGVLKPFDHGLEVPEACLQALDTLRYRPMPPTGIGRDTRGLSAWAKSNHHAFEHPW